MGVLEGGSGGREGGQRGVEGEEWYIPDIKVVLGIRRQLRQSLGIIENAQLSRIISEEAGVQ